MKQLDLKTLRSDGYLQEVNRAFFHPLGLALAIIAPTKPGEPPAYLAILDAREDPEGFRFEPVDRELVDLAIKFARISGARREARIAALGYWQQPAVLPPPASPDELAAADPL